MTFHTPEEANRYIAWMLTAHHEGRSDDYERLYFQALASSDPSRPMFRIVNLLIDAIVKDAREQAANNVDTADALIREALAGVADPWQTNTESDTK
jgi:hypothetical protein